MFVFKNYDTKVRSFRKKFSEKPIFLFKYSLLIHQFDISFLNGELKIVGS